MTILSKSSIVIESGIILTEKMRRKIQQEEERMRGVETRIQEIRHAIFTEVAKILGEAGVNMSAFTVAENSDFGILRLIVSDTDTAIKVLRDRLYAVSVADVVCLHCPNQPGALAKAMDIITSAGIFIEYMYAFSQGEAANVIIRPDNVEKCAEVLKANKLELIAASDLYKL